MELLNFSVPHCPKPTIYQGTESIKVDFFKNSR